MRKIGLFCFIVLMLVAMAGCADMLISDEFREIMEKEPSSIEEIWKIKDEYAFVSEMSMYIAEKCNYGIDLDVLSKPERVFYITQTFEMEVNNGGFWQFFYNTEKDVFCEAASAFREIGAEKTADLYLKAVAAFGEEMPSDRTSRIKMLEQLGMETGYEILSDYDEAFYSYEEDLNALNYTYIQSNRDAFS